MTHFMRLLMCCAFIWGGCSEASVDLPTLTPKAQPEATQDTSDLQTKSHIKERDEAPSNILSSKEDLISLLEKYGGFRNSRDAFFFSEKRLEEMAAIPHVEEAFVSIIRDPKISKETRFSAIMAFSSGAWPDWQAQVSADAVLSDILSHAMSRRRTHNKWGLPGVGLGSVGKLLISLEADVGHGLAPMLTEFKRINIIGSGRWPVTQRKYQYRICDLAAYLIITRSGEAERWVDSTSQVERNVLIEELIEQYLDHGPRSCIAFPSRRRR